MDGEGGGGIFYEVIIILSRRKSNIKEPHTTSRKFIKMLIFIFYALLVSCLICFLFVTSANAGLGPLTSCLPCALAYIFSPPTKTEKNSSATKSLTACSLLFFYQFYLCLAAYA